jgi:ribosomal protein S18 acetylase RimI-like enzyme
VTVKIRDILFSDKPRIIEIVEQTRAFVPEEIKVAAEIIDEYFLDPEGSGYFFYVAENDGKIAGYLCYGPTPLTQGTWDMYWAAVSPELTGKGIGGTLFKLAEADIKRRGGRMIMIETSSNPHYGAARSLYLTLGYHLISTIPDFYSPGDDKETFRKLL